MGNTQEQLTAIAAAEMAKVEWSSYERMLLQYLRGDILRGDKESAWVFLRKDAPAVPARRHSSRRQRVGMGLLE